MRRANNSLGCQESEQQPAAAEAKPTTCHACTVIRIVLYILFWLFVFGHQVDLHNKRRIAYFLRNTFFALAQSKAAVGFSREEGTENDDWTPRLSSIKLALENQQLPGLIDVPVSQCLIVQQGVWLASQSPPR